MAVNIYGDITPPVAGYLAKKHLETAVIDLVSEQFCTPYVLPTRSTKTQIFTRYNALPLASVMIEAVTPTGQALTKVDIPVTLVQVGAVVEISDVVDLTHTDPVLNRAAELQGKQSGQTLESMRLGVMKGGTNVFYANGSARNAVNTKISRAMQRRIVRALDRQHAKTISKRIKSTPDYGTEPVAPSYVCLVHTDAEGDVRDMDGFVPVEKYGAISPYPTEIGKVERVRYVACPLLAPWPDAGGDVGSMISTTGTKADVYPYLFLGEDAVGTMVLRGQEAVTPMVLKPNVPRGGDPAGQRGTSAWKTMTATVILNDAWMARLEAGVSL